MMSPIPKEAEGGGNGGLSKWELALYIGVPVTALCAAGLAYYYLNKKEDVADENLPSPEEDATPTKPKLEETEPDERVSVFLRSQSSCYYNRQQHYEMRGVYCVLVCAVELLW